jgi:hypothetical protein
VDLRGEDPELGEGELGVRDNLWKGEWYERGKDKKRERGK